MKRQSKRVKIYHPTEPENSVYPQEVAGYKKAGWDIKPFKKTKPKSKQVLEK